MVGHVLWVIQCTHYIHENDELGATIIHTEIFVVVHFDDILIYSTTKDKHIIYLRHILEVLQENELYINYKSVIS